MTDLERTIIKSFMIATIHAIRLLISGEKEKIYIHLEVMTRQAKAIDNPFVIEHDNFESLGSL